MNNTTIDADELIDWLISEMIEMHELGLRNEADEASYVIKHVKDIIAQQRKEQS
jgi:hypothetical protein